MVLAAGFGTRLSPLTDELPKPLVPVGDAPLLVRILRVLLEENPSSIAVNVHHHADKILNELAGSLIFVHVVEEHEIRGTAGGVAGARSVLGPHPVVVVNGDIVGELPVARLLESPRPETPRAGLVLAVTAAPLGRGTVGIGARGEVVRLRGETFGTEVTSGDYMGVALLEADVVAGLPEVGCLIGDVALPILRRGDSVEARLVDVTFEDIGSPLTYWSANLAWLDAENARQGRDRATSFLAEGAQVASEVETRRSIVGRWARVEGEGTLENCVIWPGAVARAPLADAIVTTAGRVVLVPGRAID